jgi:hypothetical protein
MAGRDDLSPEARALLDELAKRAFEDILGGHMNRAIDVFASVFEPFARGGHTGGVYHPGGRGPGGDDPWTHHELPLDFIAESPPCESFSPFYRWESPNDPRTRGAHKAFRDRDFGRWQSKVRPDEAERWQWPEPPSRSDSSSFKESYKERPDVFQYPGGEMFTTRRPKRSLFLSRAYLAVSEEPAVAVAAVGFRAALAAEELAVRTAPSGIQTHSDKAVRAVVAAEAKLRRRVRAALIASTPSAEPELW